MTSMTAYQPIEQQEFLAENRYPISTQYILFASMFHLTAPFTPYGDLGIRKNINYWRILQQCLHIDAYVSIHDDPWKLNFRPVRNLYDERPVFLLLRPPKPPPFQLLCIHSDLNSA